VSGSGGRRQGLIALGVGIAAAGAGAALGLAAERLTAGRSLGEQLPPTESGELPDPRGGPALGSLHGEPHIVVATTASRCTWRSTSPIRSPGPAAGPTAPRTGAGGGAAATRTRR
jgi:hypothetical protein